MEQPKPMIQTEEIETELNRWDKWINAHYNDLKRHLCTWGFTNNLGFNEDAYQDALFCVTRAIRNGKKVQFNEDVTRFGLLFISYKNSLYKVLNAEQRKNKVFDQNYGTEDIERIRSEDNYDEHLRYEEDLQQKSKVLRSSTLKHYIYRHLGAGYVPTYTKYLNRERLTTDEQQQMRHIRKVIGQHERTKEQIKEINTIL